MPTPADPHDYVGERSPAKPKAGPNYPFLALQAVASLRVAMVLFGLSLFLVFFGTLAQKHAGIERVLGQYFYCTRAWVDLNLLSDFTEVFLQFRPLRDTADKPVHLWIPFPGGYLIGWAMAINLTAAHIVRFKLTWRRAGIWILHAGMLVLLGGEFIRAEMGHEDRMSLREGGSSNYMFDLNRVELIVAKPPVDGTSELVSVPGEILAKAAPDEKRKTPPGRVNLPELPFYLTVNTYMVNSAEPRARTVDEAPQASKGLGRAVAVMPAAEVAGTETGGRVNFPAAVVEFFLTDTGESLGTYLLSVLMDEAQKIAVGDATYRVDFRLKRTPLPYTITAETITNDYYPGTETPRNYASTIRLQDAGNNEDLTVTISMNNPLRYRGATFYQSSMDSTPGDVKRTGLQVVRNPGRHLPYISCSLVALGMLIHFGLKFVEFLNKKAAAERRARAA